MLFWKDIHKIISFGYIESPSLTGMVDWIEWNGKVSCNSDESQKQLGTLRYWTKTGLKILIWHINGNSRVKHTFESKLVNNVLQTNTKYVKSSDILTYVALKKH